MQSNRLKAIHKELKITYQNMKSIVQLMVPTFFVLKMPFGHRKEFLSIFTHNVCHILRKEMYFMR